MAIPVPKKYIADFEKLGFGMFIHFGLYSQLGRGEWVFDLKEQPMSEYKKLMDTFTAEDFDAEEIVLMAKSAGCKYITLTTRHHEGFSLFDTCGLSDFDSIHSPAKRDLVREFVDACNKHGIVPFLYHTLLDWYHPDYQDNFPAYLEYLRNSVEILCTKYGKIGGLWFDGWWDKKDADWEFDKLYGVIRKHQPEAMIINNTGLSARGEVSHPEIDSITFEQGRPTPMNREGMSKYLAAEMCYTVNDHWGIGANDFNYKSPGELIDALCHCRKVGANYLLNIGPTAQGGIDPFQKELFKIIGKWMKLFGEAIYEGKPYHSYGINEKNFILKGDGVLYFFFPDLGKRTLKHVTVEGKFAGAYCFGDVADKIKSVEWMDDGEVLNFTQNNTLLAIQAEGFPYGKSCCVRVAKGVIAD